MCVPCIDLSVSIFVCVCKCAREECETLANDVIVALTTQTDCTMTSPPPHYWTGSFESHLDSCSPAAGALEAVSLCLRALRGLKSGATVRSVPYSKMLILTINDWIYTRC